MTQHHEKAYERIIQRLDETLEKAEEVTLEEIRNGIDQAIEFEEDLEELTKQEASLLGAYLKRDLSNFSRFVSKTGKGVAAWLKFDMALLENKLQNMLQQVADKSVLEQQQLEAELEAHDEEVCASGEYVVAGTFVCTNCDAEQEFIKPGFLMSCAECGGNSFLRSTDD